MASSEDFGNLDAKEIKKSNGNPTRNDVRLHEMEAEDRKEQVGVGNVHVGEDGEQDGGIISHHVQRLQAVLQAGIGRDDRGVTTAPTGVAIAQSRDKIEGNAKGVTGEKWRCRDDACICAAYIKMMVSDMIPKNPSSPTT
jgi:hypothetical protein